MFDRFEVIGSGGNDSSLAFSLLLKLVSKAKLRSGTGRKMERLFLLQNGEQRASSISSLFSLIFFRGVLAPDTVGLVEFEG